MFNMKDYLLSNTFREEQYMNELNYIIRNWFDNLLVDESFVKDELDEYNAMLNGKPYSIYTYGNKKKFVLVPKKEDLFEGDFDDIITFYKNDKSLFINIKNKKNKLFSDTTYTITMDDFNDKVKCLAIYKDYDDIDNYLYTMTQEKEITCPYDYFNHIQISFSDYWYKAAFTRTPSYTQFSERDSLGNTNTKRIEADDKDNFDNTVSMINLVDYRLNRDYGTKKHLL